MWKMESGKWKVARFRISHNIRSVGVFILLRFVLLCYRNFYYSGVYSKNISHNIRKRNQSEYKVGKIYVERENL